MALRRFQEMVELLRDTEDHGLITECKNISGFSGAKLIGALQRIALLQETTGNGDYLEVGVYQGMTLVSVAACLKNATAFGIDNFSQFDPRGENQRLVKERARLNNVENIKLINFDYEDALEKLEQHVGYQTIGTYFVDGPHDYRSQLMCLLLARPHLRPKAVIIVDDCNYRHVRLANRDFLLSNPEFKLLFESYTKCHPANMTAEEEAQARLGWWNGVNILVHDPDDVLERSFPTTYRDRLLFENEHLVHGLRYAELAPELLVLAQNLRSLRPIAAVRGLVNSFRSRSKIGNVGHVRYPALNTYSDELPPSRLNAALAKTARPSRPLS